MKAKSLGITEREFCEKYGFSMSIIDSNYSIIAKNCFNKNVNWITYNSETDVVKCGGNTDCYNLWFSDTRKDFTAEKIIQFVNDLNIMFNLKGKDKFLIKELIAPEDWQSIANVNNAYDDLRYI
jgi:hypothetical protein